MASLIKKSSGALPFSREQAFDLAADIESYPSFLPGWISARIQKRESNVCWVDQVVGFGPIQLPFTSRAVMHRPERIEVASTQAPFRQFSLTWLFEAVPPNGCRVSVVAQIQTESGLIQHLIDRILPSAIDEVIAAFEARLEGAGAAAAAGRREQLSRCDSTRSPPP
jgi:coenzyme Q-binding protein COQ10